MPIYLDFNIETPSDNSEVQLDKINPTTPNGVESNINDKWIFQNTHRPKFCKYS